MGAARSPNPRLLCGEGGSPHMCKYSGSCDPCRFWYKGICKRGQTCNFCHVNLPEVPLKVAARYYSNLVEELVKGQEKETIMRALNRVKAEVRGEIGDARPKERAAAGVATIPPTSPAVLAVIDDPEGFVDFYSNLQGQRHAPLFVPSGLNPLIWRSRCVRELHLRVTTKLKVGSMAMGQWLQITGMSLLHMTAALNPALGAVPDMVPADLGLEVLDADYAHHRGLAEVLLDDPARGLLLEELRQKYEGARQEMEEMALGRPESFGGAVEEFRHVADLVRRVHEFVQEEKKFWKNEGRELHGALLYKLTHCTKCCQIEDWLGNVEAVKLLLHSTINPTDQKGGAASSTSLSRRVKWLLKMMVKSEGPTDFQDYFDGEFGELVVPSNA